MNRAIVCDIDGTLSNFSHRLHWLKKPEKPDWDAFNKASILDDVVPSTLALLQMAAKAEWNIFLSTARDENCRHLTREWLKRHNVPYNYLLMRNHGDFRSDADVKLDHYNRYLRDEDITFVLDDRETTVEMWRGLGLVCWQVKKGEY